MEWQGTKQAGEGQDTGESKGHSLAGVGEVRDWSRHVLDNAIYPAGIRAVRIGPCTIAVAIAIAIA